MDPQLTSLKGDRSERMGGGGIPPPQNPKKMKKKNTHAHKVPQEMKGHMTSRISSKQVMRTTKEALGAPKRQEIMEK